MDAKNNVRKKWLTVRMNDEEYAKLIRFWKKTNCRQLSEYARNVVLRDPVYVNVRNKSLDQFMDEIVALRREFKAVGFNFNQVVHKLHMLQDIAQFEAWMLVNERHKEQLFAKIKAIQDKLNEAYSLWSTNSPSSADPSAE